MNKSTKKRGTISRFLRYLGKQKKKLLVVLILVVAATLMGLWAPILLGKIIDIIAYDIKNILTTEAIFTPGLEAFGKWIGLLTLLYLSIFILNYIEKYIMSAIAENVALTMRKDLSRKLKRLPLSFYDSMQKGEILSRATNDIEKVAESLREGLGQFITATITLIGAVALMFYIYPLLALVSIAVILSTSGITWLISKKSRIQYSNYQKAIGRINGNIEEAFTGQLVIKAFNHEQQAIDDFEEINQELYQAAYKSQITTFLVPPVARLISSMGYVAVAVISGYSVIQGRLSIGTVQAFIQYLYKSSEPIIEVAYIGNTMQSAIAASKRLFEIMDELDEKQDTISALLTHPKGQVEFSHVRFGYQPGVELMKDVNICLKAGDKVAIVGPTGAGKTTLVNLLMRFYDIQAGVIQIDGIDIRKLSRHNLRANFGMVLQDAWLFNGSVRDNIAYSNPNISDDKVIAAAHAARADYFIRTLPNGYQTVVNEDGTNFSQGQKQLLTIARVILADPAILILDEATSSVDTRTELEIQMAMDNLMKGRTSFIIAHRLSTIRNADLIMVMNHGCIIEQGNHEQLITKKGFYADLYNSQFNEN